MAFLALASQKSLLTLQQNFLQLQMVRIQNDVQYYASQMDLVKEKYRGAGTDGGSFDEDPDYLYYEQLDEQASSEKDAIESQITAIQNEISSLKTLVNNNIKTSCTLNLATGN
ncbi:hypothetical protein IJ596_01430 [bacterium]|nr:hypothetical protein [bacterium]